MVVGDLSDRELTLKETQKRNQKSLEHTREFCSKRLGEELSLEDARQIREDLVTFFRLLKKWDRREKQKRLEACGQDAPSEPGADNEKQDAESKPRMTVDQAVEVLEEVTHPKYTSDGANNTCTVERPEEVENEPDQELDIASTRLIKQFKERFGKKLTEDEAKEMLDFLSEDK
jgi:hypothetical protein